MSLIVVEDDSSDELASASSVVSDGEQGKHVLDNKINKASAQELTMDERSYDDAETVSTAYNDDEEKPLLELMKHLINYNGKQNTKLTNNQLIGILKKEFDLDPANLHFISVDIYMNVLKKFLKSWPQWDEFDQVMHETRCMDDHEEIEKMLDIEYTSLKEYLATILKATEPFAREAAQKLKRSQEIPESSKAVPGDVVLEINCSRDQLNKLFFRKPHPEYKGSIFNINSDVPSKICVNQQTFQSMLNSCYINITINMACFKYKREMLPNFKHMLINKNLRQIQREPRLNTHLQTPKNTKTQGDVARKDLKLVIEKIQRSNRYNIEQQHDVDMIFKTINEDLKVLPATFNNGRVEIPCTFRFHMSEYPYVRYLYEDVDTESEKYDLQLEEKISPMVWFHISRLSLKISATNMDSNWLKLECSICQTAYHGVQGIGALKAHFREAHQNEPNWSCTHCDTEFTATQLATARWHHHCNNMEEPKLFEN
ncbi:uncharacterized protein LOC134676231 [Cydia fagiglandana]|uniref:uncharacterized protein LOC134676231 n=1 Tax=Cydia fagiglandana TaxID=1458189 RepID=UPI002FEDE685